MGGKISVQIESILSGRLNPLSTIPIQKRPLLAEEIRISWVIFQGPRPHIDGQVRVGHIGPGRVLPSHPSDDAVTGEVMGVKTDARGLIGRRPKGRP